MLWKLFSYEVRNLLRSRWIVGYAGLFFVGTELLIRSSGASGKLWVSLMNFGFLVIPLVTIVFGLIHLYNSREFVELLLGQPVRRSHVIGAHYGAAASVLGASFLLGVGIPLIIHPQVLDGALGTALTLLGSGLALTLSFLAIAYRIAVSVEERMKGFGLGLLVWFAVAILYDGLVLAVVTGLSDYPIEKVALGMAIANPIDLSRILMSLQLDAAAMLGYTGAVYANFFGSMLGAAIAGFALLVWIAGPFLSTRRKFLRKDL